MIHVRVSDAKIQLPELIDAVFRGETVLIETENGDKGTLVVQLVAVPRSRRGKPKFGSAKGLIVSMADDLDAPLDDFRDYM